MAQVLEVLGEGLSFIPDIGSILNSSAKVSAKVLQDIDYSLIKKKLKAIGSVGDMTEHIEVAQLVARHLCTRYRSQLLCLKPNHHTDTPDASSSSCCGSLCSKKRNSSDLDEPAEKTATFAVAFIIQEIQNGKVKIAGQNKKSRSEKTKALESALVLTVCRAQASKTRRFFRFLAFHRKENLLIEPSAVLKVKNDFVLLNYSIRNLLDAAAIE